LAVNGGTLTSTGTIATANLDLSSGTLNGAGGVTVSNTMNWSGGTQGTNVGTTTIAAGANLNITGAVNLGRRIDNYGTATWTGIGNILTSGGGSSVVFDNKAGAQFLIQNDQIIQGDGGSAEVVVNSGLLRKTTASGTTTLTGAVDFNNSAGAVANIETGTLRLDSFAGGTNSGVLDVAAAATLSTNGSSLVNAASGIIRGSGTLDLTIATLTNNGIMAPGVGAGGTATLSLAGNLNLAGGTIEIDLGGTAPGQADKLAVTGDVTMAGALTASLVGGYTPLNGDFIPYLTMTGTASGSFVATSLPPNMDAGYNLAPGEASRLIYSTAGTKTFLNTASDLNWATPTNWSGGALPGTGNTALISSGFSVAHPSGDDSIASLIVDSGNSLDVSGGSLTVSGATTVGGSLAVTGGTLVLNGASSVQTLDMSGGALNGSGNLTVGNAFNYSSGTVGLSGALDVTHVGNLSLPAMASLTSLLVNATGNVALTGGIVASGSGDAIKIAAGQDFINSGNHPLSASNGRWLVYSQDPATIVKGGLISDFRRYSNTPGSIGATGNGFVYASAAGALLVDVVATGTASHEYGDAPTAGFDYTLSGFSDAEDNAANIGIAGAPSYNVPLPTSASDAGNYNIAYVSGLSSSVGYSISGGTGLAYSVTQAPLAITASDQSKVYGDTLGFAGTEFIPLGLKNGQIVGAVTLASSGADALAGVAGSPYAISAGAATGGSFNPANYSITYVDGALTVTPRPLTVSFTAPTKTYDGNASVSLGSFVLNNLANGDLPGLAATATYDSRDVGATKTVSYSGLALTGGKTADYSLPAAASGSGSITPLASVAWTGGASGNWSAASNWAGNALPDGNNVLAVSIPAGTTVNFDAATATTQLDSLIVGSGGSFVMAGSSLGIAGSLSTPAYTQTGGTLNGAGGLNVTQSFAKSGGTLALAGPVNITQAAGTLTLNYDAALTLGVVHTVSGNILVDANGGIFTTASPVTANGGSLAFTAHSPIHVGSGGLSATADLSLSAPTPSAGSTITLDGPLAAGGAVNVSAFGAIAQNAGIQGQTIALTSSNSNIVVADGAVSSVAAGGSISYSATAGSITSSPDNFAGATPSLASSGGASASTTSNTTSNDIITAVTQTTDALADDPVTTTTAAPPTSTETPGSPALLASVTQTTGGETGTFGATSETTVGADDTATKPPPTAENTVAEQVPEKSEAGKSADEEKDEKRAKKAEKREDRKEERRAAAKKVAQCS
ncbi:MAG: YDG domain-containing protein, partial [Sulfuritalea sp.]|nr:YDG domain-containing protein [Sulfuritalea sp.]